MGLTAIAIKAAKGRDRQYKLADSGGLNLHVLPSSQRYWRMNYRHLGKYKTLAFGVWPDVEMADARAKRDEAWRVLARGIDPSDQMKLDKIAASVAAANTFKRLPKNGM
jgi:Arm DNA-binding domain